MLSLPLQRFYPVYNRLDLPVSMSMSVRVRVCVCMGEGKGLNLKIAIRTPSTYTSHASMATETKHMVNKNYCKKSVT